MQELLEQAVERPRRAASAKLLFEKLANIDEIKPAKKPRGLKAVLRPYQEQGLSWLHFIHEIGSGGVLADDMGLGKTVQTIALLLSLKQEKKEQAAARVDRRADQRGDQLDARDRALRSVADHGALARRRPQEQMDELESANVIITSYALLRRDIDLLKKLDLDYAILDEAQNIKNPLSATAQAARELGAEHRLALTGTPIENRLSRDLEHLRLREPRACSGRCPSSRSATRARSIRATPRPPHACEPPSIRSSCDARRWRWPRTSRRRSRSTRSWIWRPDQRAIYMQVLREVRAQVMGEVERVGVAKSQLHILAGLTKLRQAACDPRLLGLPREFSHDDSGKLAALRELVDEVESGGHKVLVFSQFVSDAEARAGRARRGQDSLRVPRRQHHRPRRARR